MKVKKYNTKTKDMINDYIYDMINSKYLLLNSTDKLNLIHFHLIFLCGQFINDGFTISEIEDKIVFSIHIKKTLSSDETKWFYFGVNDLLNRKRIQKIERIKSII